MTREDAWKEFEKTGSILKYLEYKNLRKEQERDADISGGNRNEINNDERE